MVYVLIVLAGLLLIWFTRRQQSLPPTLSPERVRELALGNEPKKSHAMGAEPELFQKTLEELGWKGAVRKWLDDLGSSNPDVVSEAHGSLVDCGPDVVDGLLTLVVSDPERRENAEDVLLDMGAEAIPAVKSWIAVTSPRVHPRVPELLALLEKK